MAGNNGDLRIATHLLLLAAAPSEAAADAGQAQNPGGRQSGMIAAQAWLLAAEAVDDLPEIPEGWEVRRQHAVIDIDPQTIIDDYIGEDPALVTAFLLGRYAERTG